MTPAVRLRLDVAYDGGPFHGFARQRDPALATVQGAIEAALSRAVGHPVATVGAGRTDAGVHAEAQVLHADLDVGVARAVRVLADLDAARRSLDRAVGPAIAVRRMRRTAPSFDARFSATERRYRYDIETAAAADPLRRHLRWHVPGRLDVAGMRRAAGHLVGTHDLTSFCRRAPGRSSVRRIDAIAVSRPAAEVVRIRMRGPAFCHQQVRSIVGCLLDVGRGRHPPAWLAAVRDARDRAVAGAVAPPHGLVLEGVSYGRGVAAAPAPPLG